MPGKAVCVVVRVKIVYHDSDGFSRPCQSETAEMLSVGQHEFIIGVRFKSGDHVRCAGDRNFRKPCSAALSQAQNRIMLSAILIQPFGFDAVGSRRDPADIYVAPVVKCGMIRSVAPVSCSSHLFLQTVLIL